MTNFSSHQFTNIKGYNSLLLPTTSGLKYVEILHDGSIMQFYYHGPYTTKPHLNTFHRYKVVITKEHTKIHLYMDEDAYLFPHKISEISVGQLNMIHDLWNGTANIDIEYLQKEHPFVIWNI